MNQGILLHHSYNIQGISRQWQLLLLHTGCIKTVSGINDVQTNSESC